MEDAGFCFAWGPLGSPGWAAGVSVNVRDSMAENLIISNGSEEAIDELKVRMHIILILLNAFGMARRIYGESTGRAD